MAPILFSLLQEEPGEGLFLFGQLAVLPGDAGQARACFIG
jgi:hypothetical protein